MKRTAASIGAISIALLAPGVAAAQSGQSLRLFSDPGFSGNSVRADRSIENLEAVRFNDEARSLIAEGRWEVCLDEGYSGGCRVVQGRISDMGDWNGSLSSARYLGPGDWGDAGNGSGGSAAGGSGASGGAGGQAQGQGAYRVDFEPEVIGNIYESSFGRMTIERWDRDGASARYAGLDGTGSDAGRVDGTLEVYDGDGTATLRGFWSQANADQRCDTQRNGTYHWGAVTLIFSRSRGEFQGYWDYCDRGGAAESAWHGQLVGRDPTIAAAVDSQVAAGGGRGGQSGASARLVLFDDNGFAGRSISLNRDTPSLHTDELNFGDFSYSLAAEGRWSVCEDVDYGGECRTVEGDQPELGDFGGTISSVRYLGPGASSRVLAGNGGRPADRASSGDERSGERGGEPGIVESAAERAARVAAEEAERRVHDRIREGIGRIF
jgi:hypothetical protein